MTREEAIKILENEKKCVKRAEYCDRQCGKCELVKEDKIILKTFDMAIEALEQEPCCNCIEFKRYAKEMGFEIGREPKSEWQKDREILKAYSDGANGVLDELRAEIAEEKEHAYADFERYKVEYLGQDWEDALDSLPQDDFRYGMERCMDIINKYKTESEEQMQPERDCMNCVYSKDGHISFSETCHNCIWENQFIPKFMPKRIKASDIKPDDEWMQEDEWDEIYKKESILDKIKAEIDRQEKWLMCAGYNAYNVDIAFNSIKSVLSESEEA